MGSGNGQFKGKPKDVKGSKELTMLAYWDPLQNGIFVTQRHARHDH